MTDNDMREEDGYQFEIEAGWDNSGGRHRCRFCVISNLMNEEGYGRVAGVVAGYSGGGTFEVERFYLEIDDDFKATKLIIEAGYDAINDPDRKRDLIDWYGDDVDADVHKVAEAAYRLLFRWNDEDAWGEHDQVYLREDKVDDPLLVKAGGMLRIRTDDEPYPVWMCNAVGLTAWPVFEGDDD